MLVPKLRFKREDGTEYPEWTGSLFGEYCKTIDLRTSDTDSFPLYSLTIEDGVTPKTDRYVRDYLITKEGDSYKIVPDGAFVYNPMNLRFGAIKPNRSGISVCVSGYYDVFYIGIKETLAFWENYLTTPNMLNYYDRIATGSLIEKKRVYYSEFQKINKPLPCLEEQQKIADFLSTVDEVIAQSEAEVQNLEQQKKAAMQKIFSQEVRFKREDGTEYPEWEERQLDSFCDIITKQTGFDYTKTIKGALLTEQQDNTLPYLQTKNFSGVNFNYLTDYYIPTEVANQFSKIILDRQCLLFSIVGASVGNIALFPNTVKCFLSGAICVAKPSIVEQTAYLYYFMCSENGQSQIRNATKGSGQATITIEDIRLFTIATPCLEEQQKIADFLSAYDEAISYAKQELDKWKELKKGLLQQMFV